MGIPIKTVIICTVAMQAFTASASSPNPSVNGARIVASGTNSILDAQLRTWTVVSGVVYVQPPGSTNGKAGFSGGVTELLYDNGVIYQENAQGHLWSWTGSAWTGPVPDPRIPSPNGTQILSSALIPTSPEIIDSNLDIWTVISGVVYENGTPAGFSGGVTQLVFEGGLIYQENAKGSFWSWTASSSTWAVASNPLPVTNGICGGVNQFYLAAAPTSGLCGGGTASAISGSGPWTWSCAGSNGGTTASCQVNLAKALAGESLSADTSRANNSTFVLGESIELTFEVTGMTPSIATSLSVSIIDENSKPVTNQGLNVSSNSSGSATVTYAPPASKLGYYRVNATLADGTSLGSLGSRPAGFITYAVVSDPRERVNYGDAFSRFGLQGGFTAGQGSVIPYLGVRYVLWSGGSWSSLEPTGPGQFASKLAAEKAAGVIYPPEDPVIDQITYAGVPWQTYPMVTIARASDPVWAIIPGTGGTSNTTFGVLNSEATVAYPSFLSSLAGDIASRYPKMTNHYYQVTWEPAYSWGFGGMPDQLVDYFRLAYAAIHKADPKAVVVGPAMFPCNGNGVTCLAPKAMDVLLDLFANATTWGPSPVQNGLGLGSYVDAISIHPYVTFPPEANGLVADVREQAEIAHTPSGVPLPFVGTEHGMVSGNALGTSGGELQQAQGDVRETIVLLGEGYKFDFDFYISDWAVTPTNKGGTFGFYWNLDPASAWSSNKVGPKPVVPAYAAMTLFLDGSTAAGALSGLTGTQVGYKFIRGGTTILAVWDYQTTSTATLTVPAGSAQVCDWDGNCAAANSPGTMNVTVGLTPTYIIR